MPLDLAVPARIYSPASRCISHLSCGHGHHKSPPGGWRGGIPIPQEPPSLQLPGSHLDHLEHLDVRVTEAVFLQEGTYGVYRFLHLSQEMAVGLEEFTDELIQVLSWGLVKEGWLWREWVGLAGAGFQRYPRVVLRHPQR